MHTKSPKMMADDDHAAEPLTGSVAAPHGVMFGIAQEFRDFIKDIEELVQSMSSLNDKESASTKVKLHARISSAKDSIQRITSPLVEAAGSTVKGVDSDVNGQPWKAIGVAAALTLTVGYLLGRSRMRLDPQEL